VFFCDIFVIANLQNCGNSLKLCSEVDECCNLDFIKTAVLILVCLMVVVITAILTSGNKAVVIHTDPYGDTYRIFVRHQDFDPDLNLNPNPDPNPSSFIQLSSSVVEG